MVMTLDEAIKHCEEVAENQEWLSESYDDDSMGTKLCKECAKEHRQLAEWLKKLKAYEEARGEITRKMNSGQWSEAVVYGLDKAVRIMEKHLRKINVDKESDNNGINYR